MPYGVATPNTSSVLLAATSAPVVNNRVLVTTIRNAGATTVYIGATSNVDRTNGFPINGQAETRILWDGLTALYVTGEVAQSNPNVGYWATPEKAL